MSDNLGVKELFKSVLKEIGLTFWTPSVPMQNLFPHYSTLNVRFLSARTLLLRSPPSLSSSLGWTPTESLSSSWTRRPSPQPLFVQLNLQEDVHLAFPLKTFYETPGDSSRRLRVEKDTEEELVGQLVLHRVR